MNLPKGWEETDQARRVSDLDHVCDAVRGEIQVCQLEPSNRMAVVLLLNGVRFGLCLQHAKAMHQKLGESIKMGEKAQKALGRRRSKAHMS